MWRSGTSPTRRWQLSPSSWTDCSRARKPAPGSAAESGSNRWLGARSCTIPTSEPTTLIPHLRWARVRPGVACGIGLVLFVAALTEALPAAGYEPPGLRPGDFWTYRTNTSLASGFFLEGTATLRVLARETRTVEGVSVDVYRLSLNGLGTTNGTLHTEPVSLAFQLSVQNTTTVRFVDDTWRFPFQVGDSGAADARLNFSEDFRLFYGLPTTPFHSEGLAWQNVTYVAEAEVSVEAPAGSFDTVRIRRTYEDGTYVLSFHAPAAGNDARSETHNGSGALASAELIAYRYQALEPSRFLGLTVGDWTIAGVAALAAVGSGAFLWDLRRRRRRSGPPP